MMPIQARGVETIEQRANITVALANETEHKIKLHPKQLEVFSSSARFRVLVAGRRFGKTWLAAAEIIAQAAKKRGGAPIMYVAPSYDQGKRAIWSRLQRLAGPLLEKVHETEGYLVINGVTVYLRGADKPSFMRGVGLSLVVLDEYATMKPEVWTSVLAPALMDHGGGAIFIGTPRGKNHFYDLYLKAGTEESWARWNFSSYDNPYLEREMIDAVSAASSSSEVRRELLADFVELGGEKFKEDWLIYGDEPPSGDWFIALDPAGFVTPGTPREKAARDKAAIAVVKSDGTNIYVRDIIAGHWSVSETAERFVEAARSVPNARTGIEKGALANALAPEIDRVARASGTWVVPQPLHHGGTNKQQRIAWALEAAFEAGRITLRKAPWNKAFVTEYLDYPNPTAHDDMLDALAYTTQLFAKAGYVSIENTEWA